MSYDEDINVIKREVAERIGISLMELDAELEEIRSEAPGLISDRLALLLLLERRGISDPELVRKLSSQYAMLKIGELVAGMQGVSVLGRIIRFLRSPRKAVLKFVIEDNSGKAVVIIVGRNVDLFRKIGFDVGDIILIKNAKVMKTFGTFNRIYVDDDSEIHYLEETDLVSYPVGIVPSIPVPLGVREALKIANELIEEGSEIDVKGYLVWVSNLSTLEKAGNRSVKRLIFRIADEVNPEVSLRVVAWGSIAEDILAETTIGDLLLLQGGVLKINEYLSKKTGEQVIEMHLGGLSNFKVIGFKRDRISELEPNTKANLFVYVLSNPVIRGFTDDLGRERNVLYLNIGDESGSIRLVVWRDDYINVLKDVNPGCKLRVSGIVRESKFGRTRLELHVSSQRDFVKINPKNFPKNLTYEKVLGRIKEASYAKKPRKVELIEDFTVIPYNQVIDITGTLISFRKLSKEQGPLGVAQLRDEKGNEIALMIWNEEIASTLMSTPTGRKIIVRNARTPKEDRGKGPVVFVGERSKVEIMEPEEIRKINLKPLSLAKTGKVETVFGTITDLEYLGYKGLCKSCGLPIISKAEDGDICPRGHITKSERLPVLILIVDDDIKSARVIVKGNAALEIVDKKGFSFSEALNNKDLQELIRMKLIGTELAFRGEISEESLDTDYLTVTDKVFEPPPSTLKNAILYYEKVDDEPGRNG